MSTRRRFLQLGVAGSALLLASTASLALRGSAMVPVPEDLTALSPREYSILWAIAETLLPGDEHFPAASALGVTAQADRMLAAYHPADAEDVRRALVLVENALTGLLFDGRLDSLSRAPVAVRRQVLEGWRDSSVTLRRTVFKTLHNLCNAAYWGNPRVYALVGYPGPPRFPVAAVAPAEESP